VIPSGGPRDTTPPQVIGEKPENGSTNFTGKLLKITFDEFVTLNNPNENVIFSPPMDSRVDYSTQGKSMIVKFNDTLRSNTTYNLFFSDCIQDFREGNKLSGYNFAFSTGDSIDKHSLFGKVVNAETNKTESGIFVMLYDKDIDSLPLTVRPSYLTKTNEQGAFSFLHLKPNNYKIFALKDINSDFKYSLPNELIAFADSTFPAKYYATDSLYREDASPPIILRLFQEADTVQTLAPYINPKAGVYHFPFKLPVHSYHLNIESDSVIGCFSKFNTTRDTLSLYLKTLFTDWANAYIYTDSIRGDTIKLSPYKPPQQKNVISAPQTLKIGIANADDLYEPTLLHFSYPLKPADSLEMKIIATLFTGKDTTAISINIPDDFIMQIPVPFKFEPKINYTIWFRDSLFYGYDGTTHDTISFSFSKKTEKDYGNLIIHYKVDENNAADFLVELLSSAGKVMVKETISYSKTIEYKHLLPGAYRIRVVEDRNKNGKWDTGNYRKKEQPEKIFTIDKEITIRGFWDIEEYVELRAP